MIQPLVINANPDPLIQPSAKILTQILNDPAISKAKLTMDTKTVPKSIRQTRYDNEHSNSTLGIHGRIIGVVTLDYNSK